MDRTDWAIFIVLCTVWSLVSALNLDPLIYYLVLAISMIGGWLIWDWEKKKPNPKQSI